ncbi:MAG: DUF1002 domain-containing protein [Clostridioides sp.]|jgi:uncharacterized protein YpuA (DUF1002 family)|nr:DUF1002 domain-containing protein [Clostridioides sp.]
MKFKKIASSIAISMLIVVGSIPMIFADGANVVTLGTNLSAAQKEQMLNYFGVKKDETNILEVNNQEERQYLEGVATDAQLGKVTISCSFVEPTASGGINVKTANLTWVTSSMIATTLSTAGVVNANVIAAAPYNVSGTGALTGVMKAFESASGEKLSEEKKELASEELVTTGNLGQDIGQDQATGVVNDIKSEIIKNGTSDTNQIADVINNITNNYNITLTDEQIKQLTDLMSKIASQNYDYNSMKDTFNNVQQNVTEELKNLGVDVNNTGFFDSIKNWFAGIFSSGNNYGILNQTNDEYLGKDAITDSTEKGVLRKTVNELGGKVSESIDKGLDKASEGINKAGDTINDVANKAKDEGFFDKIINWFKNLF